MVNSRFLASYSTGQSMTENPELTPPSFEWLALVRINVPKFSFIKILLFSRKRQEYNPNSLSASYILVSVPFLNIHATVLGGYILSMSMNCFREERSSSLVSLLTNFSSIYVIS